jgi:multisubunit Na+/H+ antiporter MnhG subunit
MTSLGILRAVLVLVTAAHLFLGAVAFISVPDMITRWAASTYGATITLTPALQHVVRILGAFMLAVGIMAAFALRDPVRNRAIIDGIAILQLLRVAQRVFFSSQIQEVFAVPSGRLMLQSAFFLALGLALLLLRPAPAGARA